MSDQQNAELIAALSELRQRYPQWRFGQLIVNVAGWPIKTFGAWRNRNCWPR